MSKYLLAFLAIFSLCSAAVSAWAGNDNPARPLLKGRVVFFEKWLICDEQFQVEQILTALQKGEPTTAKRLFRTFAKTKSKKHTGTACALSNFTMRIDDRVAFFKDVSWTANWVGHGYVIRILSRGGNAYYTFSSLDVIDFEL